MYRKADSKNKLGHGQRTHSAATGLRSAHAVTIMKYASCGKKCQRQTRELRVRLYIVRASSESVVVRPARLGRDERCRKPCMVASWTAIDEYSWSSLSSSYSSRKRASGSTTQPPPSVAATSQRSRRHQY